MTLMREMIGDWNFLSMGSMASPRTPSMRNLILTSSSLDSMWMSLARFWTAVKMMVLTSLMIEPSWSASFSMEMTSSSSPLSRSTTWMMKPSVASRRTWMAVSLLRRASWMARFEAAKTLTFRPRKDSMASIEDEVGGVGDGDLR